MKRHIHLLLLICLLFCAKAVLAEGLKFTRINDPSGPGNTQADEINASGQIVGVFFDDDGEILCDFFDASGVEHRFLATPEPESAALVVLGGALLGLLKISRRLSRLAKAY